MLLSTTTTVTDTTGRTGSLTTTCTVSEVFTLGETQPGPLNVGLAVSGLAPADLDVVAGDFLMNPAWLAANPLGIVSQKLVKGHVVFTAGATCYLVDSIVQGRPFTGAAPRSAIIYARSGSGLLHLTNVEAYPIQPDVGIVCAAGERIGPINRCNFHHGSDLVDYWNQRPAVYGSWFHDFTFWANDPKHTQDGSHPGWSHNDLIQNSGSIGGQIRGNRFDCYAATDAGDIGTLTSSGFPAGDWGSSVMLTPTDSTITGMVIEENWFYGAQAPVCLPFQSGGSFNTGNSWIVRNNRFGDLPHKYGTNSRQMIRWGNLMGPTAASCSGNAFLDTPALPSALRGIALPAPILQGSNDATGQRMVQVLQT
jgi:hypothetical protein